MPAGAQAEPQPELGGPWAPPLPPTLMLPCQEDRELSVIEFFYGASLEVLGSYRERVIRVAALAGAVTGPQSQV